jgi:hypothetical protein
MEDLAWASIQMPLSAWNAATGQFQQLPRQGYDERGHALTMQEQQFGSGFFLAGTTTCLEYDVQGQLIRTMAYAGSTLLSSETRSYTAEGRLQATTDALGVMTVQGYGGGWITDTRRPTGVASAGLTTAFAKYSPQGVLLERSETYYNPPGPVFSGFPGANVATACCHAT